MNPLVYFKAWAHENPVQARYLLTALVGGVTAATGAPAELVLAVLTLVGGWAMQSTRARVTPEHKAQARIKRATAAEREKHTVIVRHSVMGDTSVAERKPVKKPAPRKRAPRESGQVWVPFLLGAVCAVLVLLLAGRVIL